MNLLFLGNVFASVRFTRNIRVGKYYNVENGCYHFLSEFHSVRPLENNLRQFISGLLHTEVK